MLLIKMLFSSFLHSEPKLATNTPFSFLTEDCSLRYFVRAFRTIVSLEIMLVLWGSKAWVSWRITYLCYCQNTVQKYNTRLYLHKAIIMKSKIKQRYLQLKSNRIDSTHIDIFIDLCIDYLKARNVKNRIKIANFFARVREVWSKDTTFVAKIMAYA